MAGWLVDIAYKKATSLSSQDRVWLVRSENGWARINFSQLYEISRKLSKNLLRPVNSHSIPKLPAGTAFRISAPTYANGQGTTETAQRRIAREAHTTPSASSVGQHRCADSSSEQKPGEISQEPSQGLPLMASRPSRRIIGMRHKAATGSAHLTFQTALTTSPAKAIQAM